MYLYDPSSDPWMVILSQTRIEYGLWLNSERTPEENQCFIALSLSLYICYAAECGTGRQRCTVSPLSHLLSPLFIDPDHTSGIYLCIVWVFACMLNVCVCKSSPLCPWIVGRSMPECVYVRSMRPLPPTTAPLISPLMTECINPPPPPPPFPLDPPKNWWCCHPESLL